MDRAHFDFTASFAEVYDRYLVPDGLCPSRCRLSERVSATAPRSVLETAAGTGVVTRELARILPGDVSITATDLNEPMIALAQSNLGSERILWRQVDAVQLPFGDA
jgi:ubiquinone/menaquinone biosynthesis C-methylase UbiE